jgi:hypothetical protein
MMTRGATAPDRALQLGVLVSAASMHGATAEIAQAIGRPARAASATAPPAAVPASSRFHGIAGPYMMAFQLRRSTREVDNTGKCSDPV